MAIFTTGPAVGAISGNVGGANFVNARGSKVIRKTRRPTKNNSTAHAEAQNDFINAVRKWKTITELERTAWRNWTTNRPFPNRLGVQRTLSGYQAFVQYNAFLAKVGPPINDGPPIDVTPQNLTNFSLSASGEETVDITFEDDDPSAERHAMLYGRPLYTTVIPRSNNTYPFVEFNVTTGFTWNIGDNWRQKYGVLIEGQVIAVRVIPTERISRLPEQVIDLYAIVTA